MCVFAACSHGNNPRGGKGAGTYIGTKTPEEAKAVGDTTTSRTLGVGLKQDKQNLVWCKSSAQAHDKEIATIVCYYDSDTDFDLNAASKLCGGDEFVEGIIYYWSSNQWHNVQAKDCACGFLFQNKYWFSPDHKSCNDGASQKGFTCAIREF